MAEGAIANSGRYNEGQRPRYDRQSLTPRSTADRPTQRGHHRQTNIFWNVRLT
jgi:hypothetical protein